MFSKEIFCARLKEQRGKRGLSQTAVGAAFGVPKQYVSRWEKGDVEPDMKTLVALADYFEVSLDYLVGRSDVP